MIEMRGLAQYDLDNDKIIYRVDLREMNGASLVQQQGVSFADDIDAAIAVLNDKTPKHWPPVRRDDFDAFDGTWRRVEPVERVNG